MYLVLIAWFYVTLMMAIAEASAPHGTLLGAAITFALYGLLPMAIVGYILGTPARKRKLRAQQEAERAAHAAAASGQPDGSGHAPAAAEDGVVAPIGKKP